MSEPIASVQVCRGLTTADVARRYRVGEDRVRAWIKSGALRAINTSGAACAKPRFVILPEALAEFERTRAAAQPATLKRPKRRPVQTDYFPD